MLMFLVCHFTLVSLQFFFFSGMSLKIVDWKRTQLFPTFYEYFIDFFWTKWKIVWMYHLCTTKANLQKFELFNDTYAVEFVSKLTFKFVQIYFLKSKAIHLSCCKPIYCGSTSSDSDIYVQLSKVNLSNAQPTARPCNSLFCGVLEWHFCLHILIFRAIFMFN